MADKKMKPGSFSDYGATDAAKYHEWYMSSPGRDVAAEQQAALRYILGTGSGRKLLDIGCGTGFFSGWLHSEGFHVTGIDTSAGMIELAKRNQGDHVTFQLADAAHIPFENDSFEIVAFITSLEFVDNADLAVEEAIRVSKQKIVFLMLNPEHEMNIQRRQKSLESGGVFQNSRMMNPWEMQKLVNRQLPGNSELKIHGYSPDSPYYIIEK